ncbi:MAG TPA: cobyrinic acid a,c-diamide synthase [Mycobacteriales bacterium]|nr:cobyrinic acid a,c-diamide synthase [Mycobacteriales bacterium]
MPRRVTLPGADELFRSTGAVNRPAEDDDSASYAPPAYPAPATASTEVLERPAGTTQRPTGPRRPSGRQRHEEKITVYVSPSELVDLEHARLVLRAEHGLAVDRGRIVREALAVVLADLESKGEQSILVRRLRGR